MIKLVLFIGGSRGIEVLQYLRQREDLELLIVGVEKRNVVEKLQALNIKNYIIKTAVNDFDFLGQLEKFCADLFLVAGFPTIFKQKILDIPKYGVLNMHGGPLPQYRGGSPLNWQIINDESSIGVSLIKMDQGIDTGSIVESMYFTCDDKDDINTIHKKANTAFVEMAMRTLDLVKLKGKIYSEKQKIENSVYWVQRTEPEGQINWETMTARQVFNLIRALKPPYPGAFSFFNGKKTYFYDSILPEDVIKSTPGRSFFLQGKGPYFMCKDRALLITRYSDGNG